jgi:hypothetical protein
LLRLIFLQPAAHGDSLGRLDQQRRVETVRGRADAFAVVALVGAQAGDPQADEVADERLVEIDRGAQAAVRVGADCGVTGKFSENRPIEGDVVGAAGEACAEENRI